MIYIWHFVAFLPIFVTREKAPPRSTYHCMLGAYVFVCFLCFILSCHHSKIGCLFVVLACLSVIF